MMLLRGPQPLTRQPSLGDPAGEMSLRVVAAALPTQVPSERKKIATCSSPDRNITVLNDLDEP
jgi:hypothetical protein